jgi:GT2 family glycosyltransferase
MLRQFVEAVAGDPAATEVVIVLDGDVDGSYECLSALRGEFPNLRPILAEPGGQMAALEVGVRRSGGEVVLLMDDDVMPGPGLVSGHASRQAGMEQLVVVGYMPVQLDTGASPVTRLYAAEYEAHCARLESGDLDVLDGLWLGNVSVRRSDLLRVGVASDRFSVRWHADTDLGLRLREAGARGVFDRRLGAAHLHTQSAASFLRSAHERGQGAWLLRRDHRDRFGEVSPAPMLEDLPYPARRAVSFLGREGRAGWSSRFLMTLGQWGERMGWTRVSEHTARLSRKIQIVCGFRCEAGREWPGETAVRTPQYVSSTKS